jgi:hypothetical protein
LSYGGRIRSEEKRLAGIAFHPSLESPVKKPPAFSRFSDPAVRIPAFRMPP